MIYENEHGTINFWDPYPELVDKKFAINFSGGTDSTFVLFMFCEKIRELKLNNSIMPITGVEYERPMNEWYVTELMLWFQEKYPELNWLPHKFFHYHNRRFTGMTKSEQHQTYERRYRVEGLYDMLLNGRTSNPTWEEAKSADVNLYEGREERRDAFSEDFVDDTMVKHSYNPLLSVTKKFVAQAYKDNGLMEEVYPVTASCIGHIDKTDFFTKPCKTCWWCREKLWAFGSYDGGVTDVD